MGGKVGENEMNEKLGMLTKYPTFWAISKRGYFAQWYNISVGKIV